MKKSTFGIVVVCLGLAAVSGFLVAKVRALEARLDSTDRPVPSLAVAAAPVAEMAVALPASRPPDLDRRVEDLEREFQGLRGRQAAMPVHARENLEALKEVKSRVMIEPLFEVLQLKEWQKEPFRRAMADTFEKIEALMADYPRLLRENDRESIREINAKVEKKLAAIREEAERVLETFLTPDQMKTFREGPAGAEAHD